MTSDVGPGHPGLLRLTRSLLPAPVGEDGWGAGSIPLYVVVCRNADGVIHAPPGGRPEPGEEPAGEVAEETGRRIDARTVRAVGRLHLHHLGPPPEPGGTGRPYPDFVQPVLRARARDRLTPVGEAWTDTDHYEMASWPATVAEAIEPVAGEERERWALPFLRQLREEGMD